MIGRGTDEDKQSINETTCAPPIPPGHASRDSLRAGKSRFCDAEWINCRATICMACHLQEGGQVVNGF